MIVDVVRLGFIRPSDVVVDLTWGSGVWWRKYQHPGQFIAVCNDQRKDGALKTPPLASGLLAGVLREELLETGKAVEATLRPEDLSGGAIFVGNSLRGLIRCTLA